MTCTCIKTSTSTPIKQCKEISSPCHCTVNKRAGNCRCVRIRAWRQIQSASPGAHTPACTQEAEPVIPGCLETSSRWSTSAIFQERPSLHRTPPKVRLLSRLLLWRIRPGHWQKKNPVKMHHKAASKHSVGWLDWNRSFLHANGLQIALFRNCLLIVSMYSEQNWRRQQKTNGRLKTVIKPHVVESDS